MLKKVSAAFTAFLVVFSLNLEFAKAEDFQYENRLHHYSISIPEGYDSVGQEEVSRPGSPIDAIFQKLDTGSSILITYQDGYIEAEGINEFVSGITTGIENGGLTGSEPEVDLDEKTATFLTSGDIDGVTVSLMTKIFLGRHGSVGVSHSFVGVAAEGDLLNKQIFDSFKYEDGYSYDDRDSGDDAYEKGEAYGHVFGKYFFWPIVAVVAIVYFLVRKNKKTEVDKS